ncbi:S1C family serine protease [Yeosuana sp. AK3]
MKNIILAFVVLGLFFSTLQAQDFSGLYEKTVKSVVTIVTSDYEIKNGAVAQTGGIGSGVLIDTIGHVITASHVVHNANSIKVKFNSGSIIDAQIISSIPSTDIALLKLEYLPKNAIPALIGNSDKTKIGESIFIIGAPLGLEYSFSTGHLSGKMNKSMLSRGQIIEFLQTDAAINHGNSGGPMFNDKGEVIGIVSFILSQSGGFEGVGFSVSITPAIKMLFETSSIWTGFDGYFLDERLAGILNIPQNSGMLVQRVIDKSIASKIGMRGGYLKFNYLGNEILLGGDIILSVLGTSCDTPHNFNSIKEQIKSLQKGQSVYMTILRKGEIMDVYLDM